ncbi:MAG: BRO family protein [Pseudomonadota bacterium]|nr:BRO family protein [Pseudomonadota bacterium]
MQLALTTFAAEFNGTAVSVLDHAGHKWLTAEAVGLCLGYSPANARVGINNLYHRHLDRFDEVDTTVIKLMTVTGEKDTRIFSSSGCVTLGWLSNTARAAEFQRWAKHELAAQIAGEKVALTYDEFNTIVDAAKPGEAGRAARQMAMNIQQRFSHTATAPMPATATAPRITRAIEFEALSLFVAGLGQGAIGKQLGISRPAVNCMLHGRYRFSPNAGQDRTTPALRAAVAERFVAADLERLSQKYLASSANRAMEDALEEAGCRVLGLLPPINIAKSLH